MRQYEFHFSALRADWYRSNQTLPRLIRQAATGEREILFVGFPRQWIPLFEWFGVSNRNSIRPDEYLPFFSELSEKALLRAIRNAIAEQMLRPMVEAAASLDAVLSDCLYILDHTVARLSTNMAAELAAQNSGSRKTLLLTSWQAYGRPSIRRLEQSISKVPAKGNNALILPCAFRRPYDTSPTHKKICRQLSSLNYRLEDFHKIVITSLGIIPEEMWHDPAVMSYDAGVPDLYRLLRLVRVFFSKRRYSLVLDCCDFVPFSDILKIAHSEGLISTLNRGPVDHKRTFFIRV